MGIAHRHILRFQPFELPHDGDPGAGQRIALGRNFADQDASHRRSLDIARMPGEPGNEYDGVSLPVGGEIDQRDIGPLGIAIVGSKGGGPSPSEEEAGLSPGKAAAGRSCHGEPISLRE